MGALKKRLDPRRPAHRELLARFAQEDFAQFAPQFLKIENKAGEVIPFALNHPQKRLLEKLKVHVESGAPPWVVILKARQMGFSTLVEGLGYAFTGMNRNKRGLVVAHENSAARNILRMYETYHANFPENWRYPTKHHNERGMFFSDDDDKDRSLDSQIKVAVASKGKGAGGVGRSSTLQFLHASEVAFWGSGEDTATALMQTCTHNTKVFLESTANGVGGYFYDTFQQAWKGHSDFLAMFFPWYEMPEYCVTRHPETGRYLPHNHTAGRPVTENDLDGEEPISREDRREEYRLLDKGLTPGQIMWRRKTIRDKTQGKIDKFKQEYPATPDEAFITTGRTVFDMTQVKSHLDELEKNPPQPVKGSLLRPLVPGRQNAVTRPLFAKNPEGALTIFAAPEPDWKDRYVIGADIAEGLPEGDESVAHVYDRAKGNVAAVLSGHIAPDEIGNILPLLGAFYNKAMIAVEANNHGYATLSILKLNYPQSLIYKEHKDNKIAANFDRLGWYTTTATKSQAVGRVKVFIDEDEGIHPDLRFWEQCLTFIQDEKGRYHALNKGEPTGTGKLDDFIMSLGITLCVADSIVSPPRRVKKSSRKTETVGGYGKPKRKEEKKAEKDPLGALHGWQ